MITLILAFGIATGAVPKEEVELSMITFIVIMDLITYGVGFTLGVMT